MMIGRGSDAVLYYGKSDKTEKEKSIPKFNGNGLSEEPMLFCGGVELAGTFKNSVGIATDTEENMKIADRYFWQF